MFAIIVLTVAVLVQGRDATFVRRHICLLILFLTSAPGVRATTILALYTPTATYIGSDSQVSLANGSEARNVCKIHVTKDFVWASAGLLMETQGPFDLRDIARRALSSSNSFGQAVDELESQIRREYPNFQRRALQSGVDLLNARIEIIIGGIREPDRLSVITFSGEFPNRINCPSKSCETLGLFELGKHEAVDRVLDRRPVIWKEMGIPEAMKYLIVAQENATPRFVSGPVAIVRIDRNGTSWISRGTCR